MSDSTDKNVFQQIVGWVTDLVAWVKEQITEDVVRDAIWSDLGLKVPSGQVTSPDDTQLTDSIDKYRKTEKPDEQGLQAGIEDLKALLQTVRDIVHATQGGSVPDEVFDSFMRVMTSNYIRLRFPIMYWLAQPLALLDDSMDSGILPSVTFKDDVAGVKGVIHAVPHFLSDPINYVEGLFPPLDTEAHAEQCSVATLLPLAIALGVGVKLLAPKTDFAVLYGWEPDQGSTTPLGDTISNRTLSFSVTKKVDLNGSSSTSSSSSSTSGAGGGGSPSPADSANLGGTLSASLALMPGEHGGPGLFFSMGGAVDLATVVDGWQFESKVSSASAFSMLVRDWDSATGLSGPADASVEFKITRQPDPGALPYIIDLGSRVRIELGNFAFSAALGSTGPALRLATGTSALVIESSSDAVLDRAKPSDSDAFRVEFQLALGLAHGRFFIEGGSGLEVTLPASQKFGPVQVRGLTISLVPSTDPSQPPLTFEATATIVVTLGPFTLTVDRIGLTTGIARNITPIASFHPPNGAGVVIQSEVVSGGGYIFFDHQNHQYAGVLQLSILDKLTLKAIAVLTTQPFFSFVIIITATGFPPISLGFGFQLSGIGGMLGLDREADTTALEAGVKNHTLDSILFPPDPVANAARIVTAINTVFPPKKGQTIFGPMVEITWGAKQLVVIDIAIIVQIPSVRLIILGKLKATFPTAKAPVVNIEIDLVGDIDFDKKRLFVEASLVNSKLAGFTLGGDAAMLLLWGDNGTYIISLGGFNKRYLPQVPTGFPSLARLSVGLSQGKDFNASIQVYCAVTSNSFQIGGSLSVTASKFGIEIKGSFSVDALFQSVEPTVTFDLNAGIQITAWGETLLSIQFEGTLQGTHPWHIVGKATFKIWIFSHSFDINHTFGDSTAPATEQQQVEVSPLLRAELADPRNWTSEQPDAAQALVTLKPPDGAGVVLHPLGSLIVAQRLAPLGVNLTRFGDSQVQGQSLFTIDSVSVAGSPATFTNTQEPFARGQFVEMTMDEKLTSPAFEPMNSGVRIAGGVLTGGTAAVVATGYRTFIWDDDTQTAVEDDPYTMQPNLLLTLAATAPAAKALLARSNGARFRGPARPVQVASLSFIVASTDDQSTGAAANALPSNYTAAASALKTFVAANPKQRGKFQVLAVTK